MNRKRSQYCIAASLLILILTAVASMVHGVSGTAPHIIWLLRAPRCLTAILAGAALALSGTQMQSILRNPLADPHIMGVSAGAALGAAVATMWQNPVSAISGPLSIAGSAFVGAAAAAAVIMAASRKFANSGTLLIFGVMMGFIVNALMSILLFSSDPDSLRTFYSWSAGSFSHTTWPQTAIIGGTLIIAFLIAYNGRKGLDIILFGDEFARLAGADTRSIRFRALLSCCLLTGTVTAFCGPIGFVGIVAPHIAKSMTGTATHKTVLPTAMLIGALISLAADLMTQMTGTTLPVGSTMAMIGIPIILYILIKKPSL